MKDKMTLLLVDATLRDADNEWHIECRFSDGQKFSAITIDKTIPEAKRLAINIQTYLLKYMLDK